MWIQKWDTRGSKKRLIFFHETLLMGRREKKWVAARSTYFSRFFTKIEREKEKYKGVSWIWNFKKEGKREKKIKVDGKRRGNIEEKYEEWLTPQHHFRLKGEKQSKEREKNEPKKVFFFSNFFFFFACFIGIFFSLALQLFSAIFSFSLFNNYAKLWALAFLKKIWRFWHL